MLNSEIEMILPANYHWSTYLVFGHHQVIVESAGCTGSDCVGCGASRVCGGRDSTYTVSSPCAGRAMRACDHARPPGGERVPVYVTRALTAMDCTNQPTRAVGSVPVEGSPRRLGRRPLWAGWRTGSTEVVEVSYD